MRMGKTVGLSSKGCLNLTAVPSLRVLALVTDAFGGHGGIAQYNRDFLASLVACGSIAEVTVLPRFAVEPTHCLPAGLRQLRPVKSKFFYSLRAMQLAITY